MSDAFPAEWGIAEALLIAEGIGGTVWRVKSRHGRSIVKKASGLALPELPHAIAYLRWRGGDGMARLMDHRDDWVLLEDAGERHLLDRLADIGDDGATRIAARLLVQLHTLITTEFPSDLMGLREHFGSLFKMARDNEAEPVFHEAAKLADRLLSSARSALPLHGDFHHENLLDGPRGWLAIDPKGLIGDPAYDAANLFYNPLESTLRTSPERASRMAAILSEVLALDPERLLGYGFAHACLSASWHMEDGDFAAAARSLGVAYAVHEALSGITP